MKNNVLIHLNKTDFIGGEVINGELELQIDTTIPVRGVRLLLHGYEQSYWSRGAGRIRSEGTGRLRASHSETRDLVKEEITLFGDPPLDTAALLSDSIAGLFASGHYHRLEPGKHRYPFSFTLPENLPGDYEAGANRSKIRYLLKGYLDIPMKIDIEQTIPLTIHETRVQSAAQPVSVVDEKSLFEAGTSVKIKADLEKNTYLPGENVDCHLLVENNSGKPVHAITIALQKVETLHAQSASTTHIEEVLNTKQEANIPTGKTSDLNVQFAIPDNLYPTIVTSRLVQVEYRIVVGLEIPWASGLDIPWAIDLDAEIPILVREAAGQPSGIALETQGSPK